MRPCENYYINEFRIFFYEKRSSKFYLLGNYIGLILHKRVATQVHKFLFFSISVLAVEKLLFQFLSKQLCQFLNLKNNK